MNIVKNKNHHDDGIITDVVLIRKQEFQIELYLLLMNILCTEVLNLI